MTTVSAAPVVIELGRPDTWPVRMTRPEVALVLRCSVRTLHARIKHGRVPPPEDGHTWAREDVEQFARKRMKDFEKNAERRERQAKSYERKVGMRLAVSR